MFEIEKSKEALRLENKRITNILESIPDAFISLDHNWCYCYLNSVAEKTLGRSREELLGKDIREIYSDSHALQIYEYYSQVMTKGRAVTFEHYYEPFDLWLEIRAFPSDEGISVILRDVTDKKQVEKEFQDSQRDLSNAQAVSKTGSWRLYVKENKLIWSDETYRMFGIPSGTPMTYDLFLSTIHPDDREYVNQMWTEALRTGSYNIEHRITVDRQIKWVNERAILEFDSYGKLIAGFGTVQDITDLIRLKKQMEDTLQKLEASNKELEQFAYVASHDLQEPLRMISGYTRLLEKQYKGKLDSKADERIEFITEGAKRMQSLILGLLSYARVTTKAEPFTFVDLNVLVHDVLSDLTLAIEESKTKLEISPMPVINADPLQMRQLFQNLISNAIKFCSKDDPLINISSTLNNGEWTFSVRDNGIGIARKHYQRIFLIFQRLHERDKYPGTGIGLSICKKIVERHGGHIWVESQEGEGSTFYFTIPL